MPTHTDKLKHTHTQTHTHARTNTHRAHSDTHAQSLSLLHTHTHTHTHACTHTHTHRAHSDTHANSHTQLFSPQPTLLAYMWSGSDLVCNRWPRLTNCFDSHRRPGVGLLRVVTWPSSHGNPWERKRKEWGDAKATPSKINYDFVPALGQSSLSLAWAWQQATSSTSIREMG